MNISIRGRSWIGQVLLYFFLSLLFSSIPFAIELLRDKASLAVGVFHAWYAAFPPMILLLLGWLLYRHEPTPTRIAGRIWIGVDICIEHIAEDYNPPDPPTGMVEPRGNFLTENSLLVSHFAGLVRDYNAYRTLLFPTGTPLSVPTDAGMFALSGYPVSSLINGPVWFFDDDDTLERVANDQLAPLSAMYAGYIFRIGRIPTSLLRFELNTWTIILTAVLLTPLATVSVCHWPKMEGV